MFQTVKNPEERRRLALATTYSLIIHVIGLLVLSFRPVDARVGLGLGEEPLVVRFEPRPPEVARQVVDTLVPATEAPDPSADLISDQDSKASGLSEGDGSRPGPHFEQPSEFDELALPAPRPEPQPAAALVSPPSPAPSDQEPAPTMDTAAARAPVEKTAKPPAADPGSNPVAVPTATPAAPESVEESQKPEQFQLAKADPPPMIPAPQVGQSRGRAEGEVKNLGFLGFEAMKNELAPYLQEIRRNVEKRWIAALNLRYPGTQHAQAVVECAISQDGKLVYVKVVDSGAAIGYAQVCKEAIEKAAPFSPFPFKVPDVYRSKNLEIRWTFTFL